MDKLPKKSLDIEQIIDKIKNIPIDDKDKAALLEQIKNNIVHPSAGENKSLDNIQDKYKSINMPNTESFSNQNQNQNMNQSQPMTVAHFEILKNKLDSLQYELIDLLRHVKDYTQRYMNAVRQQDLDKINEYISGLFEVDKKLKEAKELTEEDMEEDEEPEEEPADRQSVISKATSGIKNIFGSIGNNVAGITSLVSNTTKIANDYLVKKVIPTSNTSNVNVTKTGSTTKPNSTIIKNKNIVSIEDYISDMNKMEATNNALSNIKTSTTVPNSNIITSSSNNINSLGSIATSNETKTPVSETKTEFQPKVEPEDELEDEPKVEPKNESEKLEGALKQLNDEMNKDIDKTVNNTIQSGGKRTLKHINRKENALTSKIKLLRLKLTKNKLQKELSESKKKGSKKNKKKRL